MTKNRTLTEEYIADSLLNDPAFCRLEQQLTWYDSKSTSNQKYYKNIKLIQILLAVSLPLVSLMPEIYAKLMASVFGASIALLEAIQQLNQYSTLWVTYRSTAEHLKHEKFLFLSSAGPYRDLDEKQKSVVLSERVEEHVSSEHANWINETKKTSHKLN